MNSRTLTRITATTLFVALALPLRLAAQGQTTHFRHYRLIDIGTFGGPASVMNVAVNGRDMNSRGATIGDSATSIPAPSNTNPFGCLGADGTVPFIFHAFVWLNGVVKDLGSLAETSNCSAAQSINDKGEIVGISENGVIDPTTGLTEIRAVLWKDGQIKDLGTFGGNHSVAGAINKRGQVAGAALNAILDPFSVLNFGSTNGTETRAFLWQNGQMQDLGTLGGPDAFAFYLNERGQVAGQSYTNSTPNPSTGIPTQDPFLWENGKMHDLGTLGGTVGFPVGLNNRGQVIGYSNLAGDKTSDPFLWDDGKLFDLFTDTTGGNPITVNALNDAGEIMGTAAFVGRPLSDAYLWRKGVARDLGAVEDDCFSEAFAINSRNQIIGLSGSCTSNILRTFLWENGSMVDLNALSSPNSLRLIDGFAINDRGEIGGVGVPPGCSDFTDAACGHAYVLIPVCADGTEGCADDPLDPAVVAQSRATSGATPKTMTAEEVAAFKERIARLVGRNRGFGLWTRR